MEPELPPKERPTPKVLSPLSITSDNPIPESEASFRAAFDASGIGMAICTVEGRWVRINESLCRILGYTREELLGITFLEITHPEDIALSQRYLRNIVKGDADEYRLEKRYIHADGHAIWVKLTVSSVFDHEDKLRFFVSQIEDVTEHRRLQRELKAANERLELATRAGGVGVWDWDLVADRMTWDEQMLRLYGISSRQFGGGIDDLRQWIHPEDVDEYFDRLQEALHNGHPFNLPFRVVRPDKEVRHLRAFATVERNAKGMATRMVGTNWDISESIHQKEDLRRLAEQAKEASQAKSQFLANISHEIRTPLNGVIGMTHLLLDKPDLTEDHRDTAEHILTSSESLLTLINQILDFSKAESGRLELDIHRFNLRALIRQLSAAFSLRAEKAGIQFSSQIDKRTPQRLNGDSGKLKQVIHNLIDNAIKFTAKGSVHLAIDLVDQSKERCQLRIAVRDTGIGIAPEVHDRLFRAFTQADPTTTRLYGGTGLGLAISKEIVELMGGEIGVNSNSGQGSEFWFTADFEKAPETASGFPGSFSRSPFPPQAKLPDHVEAVRERMKKHAAHALLAEDNRVNQFVARGMLDRLGVSVDTAANGVEAVEFFRQQRYDLVFMDVQMPEVDGLEAALAIREWEAEQRRPTTPIIAMTAHARPEDHRACLAAGMNDCIVKPLSPENVAAAINRCLGEANGKRHAHPQKHTRLFDPELLNRRLGGDPALIREVLEMSMQDLGNLLKRYHSKRQAGHINESARLLHSMIGIAASACFERFAAAASAEESHLIDTGDFLPTEQSANLDELLAESQQAANTYLTGTNEEPDQ